MSKIEAMAFSKLYPMYVDKAVKKGRKEEEVVEVICWLTGYDYEGLGKQILAQVDLLTFFNEAPQFNHNASKITGVVCGIGVETIEDPFMQKVRYLDKLVDELAKGKAMNKILRD